MRNREGRSLPFASSLPLHGAPARWDGASPRARCKAVHGCKAMHGCKAVHGCCTLLLAAHSCCLLLLGARCSVHAAVRCSAAPSYSRPAAGQWEPPHYLIGGSGRRDGRGRGPPLQRLIGNSAGPLGRAVTCAAGRPEGKPAKSCPRPTETSLCPIPGFTERPRQCPHGFGPFWPALVPPPPLGICLPSGWQPAGRAEAPPKPSGVCL